MLLRADDLLPSVEPIAEEVSAADVADHLYIESGRRRS